MIGIHMKLETVLDLSRNQVISDFLEIIDPMIDKFGIKEMMI